MYFQLFSNCFIIKGLVHDLVYDLHTGNILEIKKRISELIRTALNHKTIDEVKSIFPDWKAGIDAYLELLIDQDFAFKTNEPHKFPPLDLNYESPFELENAIIHISKSIDISDQILEIIKLGVTGLQLIFDQPTIQEIEKYTPLFINSKVRRVELILRQSQLTYSELVSIPDDRRFIYRNFDCSEGQAGNLKTLPDDHQDHLHYLFNAESIDPFKKETYAMAGFSVNLSNFIEATSRNIGLNKKICIDKDGNIKNYLSHETSFGNIKEDQITAIVRSEAFQKLWFIDNSSIEKCKNCMYRMMCYSCSDLEYRDGKYFKKDECNYNPETERWTEEN